MRFFDKDSKWNWVDEHNVFVGYDNGQDCCEHAGWYLADSVPDLIDTSAGKDDDKFDFSAYRFDKDFFQEVKHYDVLDAGGAAVFRMVAPNLPDKYLVLYNAQNGYYGHGFTVTHGGITLRSGIL